MKLEFEVIKDSTGAYAAACYQERIFVEGNCLQDLYDNIVDGLESHFEPDKRPHPKDIQLVVYKANLNSEKVKNL